MTIIEFIHEHFVGLCVGLCVIGVITLLVLDNMVVNWALRPKCDCSKRLEDLEIAMEQTGEALEAAFNTLKS